MRRRRTVRLLIFCGVVSAMLAGCRGQNGERAANAGNERDEAMASAAEVSDGLCVPRHPDVTVHVEQGQPLAMRTDGLSLTAIDTAVRHEGDYSITSLASEELPPLPQGMTNMTAATAGYRLLPGGEHFLPYAELRVAYDPGRLPEGYTPDDIYTSFYDTSTLAWVRLERVEVDTIRHEIVSRTSHFTDFINELLKTPEMPETQAFVPTAMSRLEAAGPMDGITMIQPPTANNNGTANISYPIDIPPGRGGMQPRLALNYSSGGGSGWLGVGWDIPVSSITLDTRWGVPRYNTEKETEIYLLDGEQLITQEDDGTPRPMPHRTNQQTDRLPDGTQFHARTGDAHDSIIRHGDSPREYWWEVVDRTGTTHYYGHYRDTSRSSLPAKLCDDHGNIARWPLCESRDLFGNTVRYYYDLSTVRHLGAEGRQLYLDSIAYTGHEDTDGFYTVVFCRTATPTTDIPVLCNNGFKEITDQLLDNMYVKYGDTILTAWLFDMENSYYTNYKNRLTTVAKIDSTAKGTRNFLASRCRCIRPDRDDDGAMPNTPYANKEVHLPDGDTAGYPTKHIPDIAEGYAGSTYHFSYYDAPAPDDIFGPEIESDLSASNENLRGVLLTDKEGLTPVGKATGLGLSHSSSWNIGGTVSAGFGPVVCLSTLSLGGNYSRSESASESLMTLVDLNGDGLADKVFVQGGKMYFCRHIRNGDGTISFGSPVPVRGATHFLQESGYSNTFGGQLSVGFSGSASWTDSKSTTSTYFADVNGDGLVDIVNDGQVLFNSIDDIGNPEFTLFEPLGTDNEEADDGTTSVLTTSASNCGGIIFDGEVNDSITCERVWACDTSFRCDTSTAMNYYYQYLDNPDTLVSIEQSDSEPNQVTVRRHHREWDCSYHDDSPSTDVVRVWVAPRDGRIQLLSEVGLKEDTSPARQASRHADGVVYTLQHTGGVRTDGDRLSAASSTILGSFDLCDTCYYDGNSPRNLYSLDSTFAVARGDMLFFRLRSKVSRRFDNVYDWHLIQYLDGDYEAYDSKEDFVLSSDYCFQAPVDGEYIISGDFIDYTSGSQLTIDTGGTEALNTYYGTSSISEEGRIRKNGTICLSISLVDTTSLWGAVDCRPYLVFVPDTSQYRYDTNDFTDPPTIDSTRYTDTVEGWIPYHLDIVHKGNDTIYDRPLLRRLFGPLNRGWGQFAYHSVDTGSAADYINVGMLVAPDLLVPCLSTSSDTNGLRSQLHSGDTLDTNALSGSPSYDSFMADNGGLYSPLSCSSYWVEMTPDVEHQVWVSFGRQNYIGSDSASNSLQGQWYAHTADTDGAGAPATAVYDDPVPAMSTNGTPAKAVRKENRSKSHCWSAGAAGLGSSGSKGTNTVVTDYLDLNGDRYPDNVGLERVQYSQQWGGLGIMRDLPAGFADNNSSQTNSYGISYSAAPIKHERTVCSTQGEALFTLNCENSGTVAAGGSLGRDRASGTWLDINGDGLSDFVVDSGNVYLNIGYGFINDRNWNHNTVRSGVSGSLSVSYDNALPDDIFNVWQGSIQAGANVNGSYNETDAMMTDINGDGLPDKIWRSLNGLSDIVDDWDLVSTYVSFNQGNGCWSPAKQLNIERFHASTNYSESLNAGLTYGFTLFGFKVTVGANGSPYSGSVNRDHIQLVDVDADGLPDLVSSDGEDNLTIRYNQGGKTNLLRSVTNCNNASFMIEYTLSDADYNQPSRSWLMTKVTTHDTLNTHNGATTTVTTYSYAEPRYDRYERTSYGYGTVVSSDIDPATTHRYRSVERNYYNNNMLRRGRLKREMTRDGNGNPYIERLHTCIYVNRANGDTINPDTECPEVSHSMEEATVTHFYEGHSTPQLTTGERTEYDRYHNVVRYVDLGDIGDADDGLVATFSYLSGIGNNLVGLRQDYTISSLGTSATMRRSRFEYDLPHGKLTRQVLYNGPDSAVYDFRYEPVYGNLDSAMQPANINNERMTYHYSYDSVVYTYPTRIVNSLSETTLASYDYRFGKPLTVTDPSGGTMTYRYDFAGRLVSVNSPLNTSGTPSLVNEYHPMNYYQNGMNPQEYHFSASPSRHPYSVSKHYDDNGNIITETAVLTNGFGQPIQTKKGLCVGGSDMMQVSGRTLTDAFGRTIGQYDPVSESVSTHRGRYNSGYDANSLTATTYDVLDRATSVVMPLGVSTLTDYGIDNDHSGHRRFVATTTDPNGNVTRHYSDYEGRQVQVTDADGGTTLMYFDNLGQLDSTSDPEGFKTLYAYDMLGRMTIRTHPDAGTTEYTYDNAGNLLEESNPLGQIFYDYTYYRPLRKRYSTMTGNDVTYTYGTSGPETGRPVRIVDGSGMYECGYDALGNVVDETRTIALPYHGEVFRFRTLYRYDSWGRMISMTYPDGEEVAYTYLWGGDLDAMSGTKNGDNRVYISHTTYNCLGQKDYVEYGNQTKAYYFYDSLHRLSHLRSEDAYGSPMQDIVYTFDDASNIKAIANNAGTVNTIGGDYSNIYHYDALHRLVASNGGGNIGAYSTDLAYSPSGRLLRKCRQTASASLSSTVDMAYGYCDDDQPHAVKRMFDYKSGALYDMRWDNAGNLGQVSVADHERLFESGRFLFWTEDNRMHAAVDDGHYSYYTYDHSGERRLKLTGDNKLLDVNADFMATVSLLNEPTLYPSAYMVLTNNGYTKHYYAGAERVAARLGSGGLNALGQAIGAGDSIQRTADTLFYQSLDQVNGRALNENDPDCIIRNDFAIGEFGHHIEGIPHRLQAIAQTDHTLFKVMFPSLLDESGNGQEPEVFFYHSDHLGSASWITDSGGMAVQHLQYLPYGEPYINQRLSGYNERFAFTGKERDEETGFGYFGARYMDHELTTMWLSVDPMADRYPSLSPYAYCAWNPVKLVDPDGRDWYESENGGKSIWRKGNAEKITENGEIYHNVGRYYTKVQGSVLTHYDQNNIIGKTDLNSDVGKKFSMIAAEGGWTKNEEGKTVRETQYGLYIIGASMENRLNHSKFFPNDGTYESLFNSKQYNASNSSTYKNLTSKLSTWKSWYGTRDVMSYLNAVYNATHGNCVTILTQQYGFSEAHKILGYAHKVVNLFGNHSINLPFIKDNTLIKTVQSSDYVYPKR